MRKKEFGLTKRTGTDIYYVQFRDAAGKRHKVSTGLVDKISALRLCERNLARLGIPMPLDGAGKYYFKDFARDFFDFDTSSYIKKQNGRGMRIGHACPPMGRV